MSQAELTICTVGFRCNDFIEHNIDLTLRLNRKSPPARSRWLIVDNTPANERTPPIRRAEVEIDWVPGLGSNQFKGPAAASLHHASALNLILPLVKTRFVILMDPDFFVLRPEWIGAVLGHMKEKRLAVLGSPYHPKWFTKRRGFPTTYFLLLDREALNVTQLDFLPPLESYIDSLSINSFRRRVKSSLKPLLLPLSSMLWGMSQRKYIGKDLDTGFRLESLLMKRQFQVELLQPVFNPEAELPLPSFWWKWLDPLYPRERRFVPSVDGYFRRDGFRESGYFDFRSLGFEEYFWRGQAFGVHFRGYPKRNLSNRDLSRTELINAVLAHPTSNVSSETENMYGKAV